MAGDQGADVIRRLFAQLFGFRYCCPHCGHLNTIHGTRKPGRRYNRVTGITQCGGCQRIFIAALLLWESAGGRRSVRPDMVPGPKELQQIRSEEFGIEQDELTGRFLPVKRKAGERVNLLHSELEAEERRGHVSETDTPER